VSIRIELADEEIQRIAHKAAAIVQDQLATELEPFVGVAEAAAYLSCKPQRIYEQRHRLPHYKDGRRLLFRRSELDAYLRTQ
jgi:excisionase family DNA binding protein